ncbi:hypothetical protein MPSEU_000991800 [Mayamaea pseudoterrestris]|nr:hypothetical protein MPSEU_000991800 [Mayamaea pseudoterrestris]
MDLASWALRNITGSNNDSNDGSSDEDGGNANTLNESNNNETPLSPEEMRAQRLARMEALQQKQREEQEAAAAKTKEQEQDGGAEPMDIDKGAPSVASTVSENDMAITPSKPLPAAATPSPVVASAPATSPSPTLKKKAKSDPLDRTAKKVQREKELLLKKTLSIALAGSALASDSSCTVIDIHSTEITEQSVADILSERIAMHHNLPNASNQNSLMRYLGTSHRLAGNELKDLQSASSSPRSSKDNASSSAECISILVEIQRQLVSYAATCIMAPELFPAAKDSTQQLATCLLTTISDLNTSIILGVNKSTSSFFYLLVEELKTQGHDLKQFVQSVVAFFTEKLSQIESVLDIVDGGTDGMILVSALAGLAMHKNTAHAIATLDNFLLPAAESAAANELIRPQMGNLFRMLSGEGRPYKKRSGPALEKHTILGLVLRIGIPSKTNPAFTPTGIFQMTVNSIENVSRQQRNKLTAQQEATNQFIKALIKAGEEPRSKLLDWVRDALLVNNTADAMRPDSRKVSSSNLLMNLSVALLKLCEPLVKDADDKISLIKPSFVSSAQDHGGVFETEGDHAVARLGSRNETDDVPMIEAYSPKNKFISPCFFFCARSLHYGLGPALSAHESLLRHIMYLHHDIRGAGRDIRTDPNFGLLLCRQRSNEVALFEPNMMSETLKFCNFLSRLLMEMDDDMLRTMPEDFINDICRIITIIAKLKSELLKGMELRNVFQMCVKMLSPRYGSIVRNYNLRAMLGDVLHDLYLPPAKDDDHRDIPQSVWSDPNTGGQAFLLSDKTAQETLAPSLLLLYGEVEHTGHYEKMSHRSKICSMIKFLWESSEHRPAFRSITENHESFIKFANGIMNETNTLIATVMQKLPEIRVAQEQMKNPQEWSQLSSDEQTQISELLAENEREVKHALPLANRTLQMFSYLNTDPDIRRLFLLPELCSRLVGMLKHVLGKLVGSRGLELKVDEPEQYEFRPKEMLLNLCSIFALFGASEVFQSECAKAGCSPDLLRDAAKPLRKFNLLTGESMAAFEALPALIEVFAKDVSADDELHADAPDEFLDELLCTFMKDPVKLPSGHFVDRSTITQHLLNDPMDPFSREPMSVDDIAPATELKVRMDTWLAEKRVSRQQQ